MRNPLPVEELEELANVEIGEALRRTRLYYGQTLPDIEKALRIRACQIEAIENGDMERLPGRVYAIGFVRSYAEYLGLDGAKVIHLYKAQYMDGSGKQNLSFPVAAGDTKTPALWLMTLCLICACAGIYLWNDHHKPDRSLVMSVENVPDDIKTHVQNDILTNSFAGAQTSEDDEFTEDAPPEIENMDDGAEQSAGIILNILDNSWVEIKNAEGEIIVSNILEKDDQYFVPDSPGLSMSLGNAANVEIIVAGRALKPLGKSGDVRRDIPLNMEHLKTLEFKEVAPVEAGALTEAEDQGISEEE